VTFVTLGLRSGITLQPSPLSLIRDRIGESLVSSRVACVSNMHSAMEKSCGNRTYPRFRSVDGTAAAEAQCNRRISSLNIF
jgi:hypothetical protein